MINQMFSAENFREIFDFENRRGLDIGSRFFPNLDELTSAFLDKRKEIRILRSKSSSMAKNEFLGALQQLRKELEKIKRERSEAIDLELVNVSKQVHASSFKLNLKQSAGPSGKVIYTVDDSAEAFFVNKQLQRNIRQIFRVKQASRPQLASQVQLTLSTKFPLELVRTDISEFYESIDRKRLIAELDRDPVLSASSKRFIKQLLGKYGELTDSKTGIPRGVGVSAYLAELYLKPVDYDIRRTPGLLLYCRYVDDIVAIFARPPVGEAPVSYLDHIKGVIASQGLSTNPRKTSSFATNAGIEQRLIYLGYRIRIHHGRCRIWPSAVKARKYRARMRAAFAVYQEEASRNARKAFRALVGRIKFLTGNTRLTNSKGAAATGIYYNNALVTELSTFKLLDKQLRQLVLGIKRPKLRARLKKYTFVDGFLSRRYHNFSPVEMHSIVSAWRHG